ncbi:hypothetical protein TNCV_4482661 [Trichonephila clavipes]|nr:hypothetical protein TNCV_4482661 [Trichonephila clavipes]
MTFKTEFSNWMVNHDAGRPMSKITSMNISLTDGLDKPRATTLHLLTGSDFTYCDFFLWGYIPPLPVYVEQMKQFITVSIDGLYSDIMTHI